MYGREKKYRLLSLDGGGIYGLFTVHALRKLCEDHPDFLSKDNVHVFAGTSAGALISLLLAKEESPRDALLSGEIEAFFKHPLLHENNEPLTAITSLMGLTSWCSGPGMERLLKEHLGDLTLKDLPHKVLIMTFDITQGNPSAIEIGQEAWNAKVFHNFYTKGHSLDTSAAFVAYGAACPVTYRPVKQGITDGGIFAMSPSLAGFSQLMAIATTKADIFKTYLNGIGFYLDSGKIDENPHTIISENMGTEGAKIDEALERYRKHLEHVRETLLRMERNFLLSKEECTSLVAQLDEGLFDPKSPKSFLKRLYFSIQAECRIIDILTEVIYDPLSDRDRSGHDWSLPPVTEENLDPLRDAIRSAFWKRLAEPLNTAAQFADRYLDVFRDIEVFSLGVGTKEPTYFLRNFDFGGLTMNMFPTNLLNQFLFPPSAYMLYSPETYATDYIANNLLANNYIRCDPEVLGWPVPPVVIGLFLTRFSPWRNFIVKGIEDAMPAAAADLARCAEWLKDHGWIRPKIDGDES